MGILNETVVSNITSVYTVDAEKGKHITITNRASYGLSFGTSGKITYTHNGKKFISTPDCAVIIPQNASYKLYNNEEGSFPLINFVCSNHLTDEFICIPIKNLHEYIKDYEHMKLLSISKNNRLKCVSILYNILNRLETKNTNVSEKLTPVLNYINIHFCDADINNFTLAEIGSISEVYLRRIFMIEFNTTPKQYIIDMRIKYAEQLLLETKSPISEIADKVGFSNIYHFCRCFKSKTDFTPSQYRQRTGK